MEFPFSCEKVLTPDQDGFVILDGKKGAGIGQMNQTRGGQWKMGDTQTQLFDIVDKMGAASSKAQGLPSIITSAARLFTSDNRLYMRTEGKTVVGLLKVGVKKLFIRNEIGAIKEISPLCVLDFYVHESVQRGGQGKQLFERMLAAEGVKPEKLGYDRPSEKLIGFLGKHYGLKRYVPQNNNYVVFNAYFETEGTQQRQTQQESSQMGSFAFGQANSKGRAQAQPSQSPFAQTQYQPVQKPQAQTNPIVQQPNQSFNTMTNFNQPPKAQYPVSNKLPPKHHQISNSKQSESNSLSNAGLQVFGQSNKTVNHSQQSKRSVTSDRVFGGVMSQQINQEESQKENSMLHGRAHMKKDSVSTLLADGHLGDGSKGRFGNVNDYRLQKANARIEQTEEQIRRNESEIQSLLMKTGSQFQKNTPQRGQNPTGGNLGVIPPYIQMENEQKNRNMQSQFNSTASSGPYNKRNDFAVIGGDHLASRVQTNQQFVQQQRALNNGGSLPWGNYNYTNGYQRK